MPAPDFSVLLPLQEDRGEGEACVRAWSRDQTLPRERYELVVLAPGLDPLLECVVRPLLEPGDQWIEHATPNEFELFNIGAASARGRFVFPTEAHCVPQPDCLEQMLAHLEATGGPGARGASLGESESRLGALEQEAYERDMAIGEDDDHWRKVLIHSLAIRRDVFLEAGGFEPQYGDFASWALAIALRERGHRLTFTPHSAVRHRYTGELGVLREHVRDFAHGEMLFCSRAPAALRRRYALDSREWAERATYSREGARRVLRAALAARRPGQAARHLVTAGLGPRAAVLSARAQMSVHRVMVLVLPGRARWRAYLAYWAACARLGRIEWLAGSPELLRSAARPAMADLTDPDAAGLTGFHRLEEHGGQLFRWTSPLAVACVDLPEPRPYRVELQLLPLRPPEQPAGLRVATEVGQVQARGTEQLTFTVNGGGVRSVALACKPFRPRRLGSVDRRDLGVAVRSIKFIPA